MSAIIAVCSTNFCLFAADTRMVSMQNGSLVYDNDNTEKIFKLNKNLVFGATGLFHASETLLAPFSSFADQTQITISDAQDSILSYMNNLSPTLSSRNYLIGGKDESGNYSLRYFHYNKASGDIETQIYKPKPPYLFAIVCALPQNLESDAQDYQRLVGNLVNQCDTLDNLIKGLAQIIRTISERDNSVGKQVSVVLIT